MNSKTQEMLTLIGEIKKYDHAYYDLDMPMVSDCAYDALYDQLSTLEAETGVVLSGSPTQCPGGTVASDLVKVTHGKPMLSAQKSKDVADIKRFVTDAMVPENQHSGEVVVSWKEDGLTIVLRYEGGKLIQAITRGNGIEGEDVTHTVRQYRNVPLSIPYDGYVEVRGEGVVDLASFRAYNETHSEGFSHPRNMASGSTRTLDPSVTAKRHLSLVCFELIEPVTNTKNEEFTFLQQIGMPVVEHVETDLEHLESVIQSFQPENHATPVDGLVIEHEDKAFGRTLGATGHHENCRIALKWQDALYKTRFLGVERRTTRTGTVSLTAVFAPVMIDGTQVERATLHNLSFFEDLKLGIGDEIEVYKANMIIPAIYRNNTQSNSLRLDMTCPCCGAPLSVEISDRNQTKTLHCPNEACASRLVARFEHFVSKDAANISGLAGSKLEELIDYGFVHTFSDLYHLDRHQHTISMLDGWGGRSFFKLQKSIEHSRNMELSRFILAFGIPQIGKRASKSIHKYFHGDPHAFMQAVQSGFDFHQIPDFGDVMCKNLADFFSNEDNMAEWNELLLEFIFQLDSTEQAQETPFTGKSIVATGSFHYFSRNGINRVIEKMGGISKGSVSKKTDFVIVGADAGSKKDKALSLNIPLLSERELMAIMGVREGEEERYADRG